MFDETSLLSFRGEKGPRERPAWVATAERPRNKHEAETFTFLPNPQGKTSGMDGPK